MFTLAIIGRPNVGKSTLFNRLAGKRLAIVNDTPGITRDWQETEGHLFDLNFRILDTAGLEERFDESIPARMRKQTEHALQNADVVLFMIDGRAGVTPLDEHFAAWLRKQKKNVVIAVNKCENDKTSMAGVAESYALGFGDPIPISSEHGLGMEELYHALQNLNCHPRESEDLLDPQDSPNVRLRSGGFVAQEPENDLDLDIDKIEGNEHFELNSDEDSAEKPLKIAIVGRPNVGKSTLLNAIVKDNRVMTGPEAGITRDSVAVDWTYKGRKFKLVDTAGMRRKSKVQDKIEQLSVQDSIKAIRLAQVAVLVIDGQNLMEKQDLQIAEHIINEGRALVIAVNKWDIVDERKEARLDLEYKLEKSLAQLKDIPYVTISALNGRRIEKVLDKVLEVYEVWNRRVPTGKLNRWLSMMESRNPAPLISGRSNRLKYIAQIKTRPPTFALWVSRPEKLPDAYKRYIINGLRETYDLPSVPVRLLVRKSKNPYAG
jgi:GTP-binding protein